ncbi:tripartite tricarboxylate transporter TctB family protein [Geodermatophilus sp. CPCC 206100]|uniref:tripartite tricarboxylate transporter TctB family protein n=1 Tax=Geodermatophilus sp. CPCC 206100 TaxID=3020054 RepID=UPI003B0018E3
MVGSNRYGPLVLVGAMLALGVVYVLATVTSDSPFEAKMFPLACGVFFVVLLAWEGVSLLAKGAPAPDPEAASAARAADAGPVLPEEFAPPAGTGTGGQADEGAGGERRRVARFVALIVLIVAFSYLAVEVDYVLATAGFTAASMWLIAPERSSWKVVVGVAVGCVVSVNLLFVGLLSIDLPSLIPGL